MKVEFFQIMELISLKKKAEITILRNLNKNTRVETKT
jgi:hypothetical protein